MAPRSKYKNLFIIGNGFDRWQDLPTSYEEFRNYYAAHIDGVLKDLGMEKLMVKAKDGRTWTVTPVDMAYGNPFSKEHLQPEFFWELENSMNQLDDQLLNLYYGRSRRGICRLRGTVIQAQKILRRIFSDWVRSIEVETGESRYRFGEDCFFINFNYTDTLEKRFGIEKKQIYHIHGSAVRPESIVVGHATHPETAFREMLEHHFIRSLVPGRRLARIEGLYWIEDALYRTDKHIADRIDRLSYAFLRAGLHIEDIENVYVLGHSFGEPDTEYFDFLDKVTRCGTDFNSLSALERMDQGRLALLMDDAYGGDALLEEIQLNMIYATTHRKEKIGKPDLSFPLWETIERVVFGRRQEWDGETLKEARKSVRQRFLFEQVKRSNDFLEKVAEKHGTRVPEGCHSVLAFADYLDGGHALRREDARWHISSFSPDDRERIQRVMKTIGLERYQIYDGIDGCLEGFL